MSPSAPAGCTVSEGEAREVGDALGINWDVVSVADWREGLRVELEHGTSRCPASAAHAAVTNVTDDDLVATGKIALAHLLEDPDYYKWLVPKEKAQEEYWRDRPKPSPLKRGGVERAGFPALLVLVALIVILIALCIREVARCARCVRCSSCSLLAR